MQKHYLFFGNETPDDIKQILVDNCEGMEEMTYSKQLTDEELDQARETFVNNSLEIQVHDNILDEAREVHKANIKPLKKEAAILLNTLKTRYKEVEEKVYCIADHKAGIMEYVNLEGVVIHSRRLKPEERQGKMFPIAKVVNE